MENRTRKKRKDVVVVKEKKRKLILSDSESDEAAVFVQRRREKNDDVKVGEDEDLGGGVAAKQELAEEKRGNVVGKDVKEAESVGIVREKKSESCESMERPDIGKSSFVDGVHVDNELTDTKKENSAVGLDLINKGKVFSDEKDVVEVVKKNSDESAEAGIAGERTKGVSDADVELREDSLKAGKAGVIEKEEGVVEKKKKMEVELKKRVLGSDVVKRGEVVDKEEDDRLLPEIKRNREASEASVSREKLKASLDAGTPLKRIKCESSKPKVEEVSNDTLRQGDGKGSALDNSQCLETVDSAEGDGDGGVQNQKHTSSDNNSKKRDENVKWIERSGTRVLRMIKDRSISTDGSQRGSSNITRKNGSVLKVQVKEGVPENFHSKRRQDEKLSVLGSRRIVADDGASKEPSTSVERKTHDMSNSRATMGKKLAKDQVQSPNRKNTFKEPKREQGETATADLARKTKNSVDNASIARKSFSGSRSPSFSKEKEDDCSRSTVKQNIRDKIKSLLLDAGWTIDLRPRRGKAYLDSVYIPPSKQGSYWSITKAYAKYQELNSEGAEVDKKMGNARRLSGTDSNTEGSASSLPIISLDSLSMLRRKVVNKRRSKEEIEEATWHQKRKAREISNKTSPKRYGKMKFDEIRKKRRLGDSSDSDVDTNVSSMDLKNHQSRKNNQKGRALLARGSNQEAECEGEDYVPYDGKRTVLSWMIDLGVVPLNAKVKYMNNRETKEILEGWIKREGIQCGCCSKIISLANFEYHAVKKLPKAYENIHVEGLGVSLLQCQLDAWKKQDISERQKFYTVDVTGEDPNDDTCAICGDGGDLICCDSCPSTFHLSCLGFEMLPPGDWNCTNCSCCFCGVVSSSDVHDGDRTTLLSCSQCERKYHQDCAPEAESVHTGADNSGTSFCEPSCRKVFRGLQRLIGMKKVLGGGFSWRLIRRFDEDSSESLHSVAKRAECNSKIAVALAVMDECFLPITDQRSGINLIHNVVYNCGSNFSRLNFTGFYTFVLERGEEIISAASVRFHGTRLAEMPFIGTRNMYRRQGMARRLLDGIEIALCSLNVEKLVIPAISELRDTWTNVFGFSPPESPDKLEFRSISMLVFPGTGLLQKTVLGKSSVAREKCAVTALCDGSNEDHISDYAPESSNLSGVVHNLDSSNICLPDDLLNSETSSSPTYSDVPNPSEVSLIDPKSSEVHGDEFTNITRSAVCHNSPVTKVQAMQNATCQILSGVEENRNHELKNTYIESTSDGRSMRNFTSHEPGTRVVKETQAEVSKGSISGQVKSEDLSDEPISSTGNEEVESGISGTTIKPSVASNSVINQASIASGANHEKGVHESASLVTYDANGKRSPELKIPNGSENLSSTTKSAGNCCMKTSHLSPLSKPSDSGNGDNNAIKATGKH